MAEDLFFDSSASKAENYKVVLQTVKALCNNETDWIANLANTVAVLKQAFNFFWVGFYLIKYNELVLAPFQGTVACTRIAIGKGVCGKSAQEKKTILVPNVEEFEGHIACSSLSKSEIVVPLIVDNNVIGVLDVDSDKLDAFDRVDLENLEKLCAFLAKIYKKAS